MCYDLYGQNIFSFNYEFCRARQVHFSKMINININNTRSLFVMVDKLTNQSKQIAHFPQRNVMDFLTFLMRNLSD